ncbi:MAG: hypothetical protein H8E34_00610 [Bacteroidetes bacterium]|nr:hypothetical protein [Bacteroidota bacterium]MBL6944109.1 hypothetical protein [Bacteroidales bacterium]
MKTLIKKSTLAMVTIVVLSSYIFASATYLIISQTTEANTIPYATNSFDYRYEKASVINYSLEEENYIDDIPFDTREISAEYKYLKAMKENFEFNEEPYIDDIPFKTVETVQSLNNQEDYTNN